MASYNADAISAIVSTIAFGLLVLAVLYQIRLESVVPPNDMNFYFRRFLFLSASLYCIYSIDLVIEYLILVSSALHVVGQLAFNFSTAFSLQLLSTLTRGTVEQMRFVTGLSVDASKQHFISTAFWLSTVLVFAATLASSVLQFVFDDDYYRVLLYPFFILSFAVDLYFLWDALVELQQRIASLRSGLEAQGVFIVNQHQSLAVFARFVLICTLFVAFFTAVIVLEQVQLLQAGRGVYRFYGVVVSSNLSKVYFMPVYFVLHVVILARSWTSVAVSVSVSAMSPLVSPASVARHTAAVHSHALHTKTKTKTRTVTEAEEEEGT